MIVTWTITEGAVWDWTYSSFTPDVDTLIGNTSQAAQSVVTDSDGNISVNVTTATDTGTFYTSTTSEVATTVRTTTASFDVEGGVTAGALSASFDTIASSIITFYEPTTATLTAESSVFSTVLTTTSAGTYIKPLELPFWLDVNEGDGAYAPTVVAWSSAAGYSQPTATNQTSLPSVADLSFSGQATMFPITDIFQIPSATDGGNPTGITETWQSASLTWTRQTQTNTTLTRAASGSPLTRATQTYATTINSTRTSSSVFANTLDYNSASVEFNASFKNWWNSTTLAQATFLIGSSTTAASTTTTQLVSSVARTFINLLGENREGQQPLAVFEVSSSMLRGQLQFGNYSHFYTQNAGLALNATDEGRAAISDAGQSFPLPPQSFSTVLIQRGVTVPMPYQTRLRTSSNSTTSWSLAVSALTITTSSTNSTTSGSTTSSYALSAAGPTIWSASSRAIGSTNYTAAGGHYATNSLFVGGGLFTATGNGSEFTGTAVTQGTNATAFQPLPHFVPEAGFPSVATFASPLPTSNIGPFGLRTLGFPLTA